MITLISVLIADEYSAKLDPVKAMALYKKSLLAYEKERWTPLVEHIKERLVLVEGLLRRPQ